MSKRLAFGSPLRLAPHPPDSVFGDPLKLSGEAASDRGHRRGHLSRSDPCTPVHSH